MLDTRSPGPSRSIVRCCLSIALATISFAYFMLTDLWADSMLLLAAECIIVALIETINPQ